MPNVVGVDIGCGMYTLHLNEAAVDFPRFDEAAHFIPSGMHVWEGRKESFDLGSAPLSPGAEGHPAAPRAPGTLGGGNHFIEIDRATDGGLYLIIHTGSRNLGKQVAAVTRAGGGTESGPGGAISKSATRCIAEYKAAGRRGEIQAALKETALERRKPLTIPEDLCYVYGTYLEELPPRRGNLSAVCPPQPGNDCGDPVPVPA